MTALFSYDRDRIQEYINRWTLYNNPSYPDMGKLTGNNANFAYQCLSIGGFFAFGSAYLDTCRAGFNYTISKLPNLLLSLEKEVEAEVHVKSTPYFNEVRTGDLVVVRKDTQKRVFVAEYDNSSLKFFGKDPLVRGTTLPVGDDYTFYLIPDTGRRALG